MAFSKLTMGRARLHYAKTFIPWLIAIALTGLWPTVVSAQWLSRPGPWTPSGSVIAGMAVLPSTAHQAATLFTAAQSRGQLLFRSSDEGLTWQAVAIPGHDNDFVVWVGSDSAGPAAPANLYVTIFVDGGFTELFKCDILRSADSGATWVTVARKVPACSLAFDPSSPQRIFAWGTGYPATYSPAIYRSDDAGRTWASIAAPATNLQTYSIRAIRISEDGGSVYVIPNLWVSHDHGSSWTGTLTTMSLNDVVAFRHPQFGNDFAIAATRDGLYQTVDGGTTWHAAGLQGFLIETLGAPTVADGQWRVAVGYRGGAALLGSEGLVSYRSGLVEGQGLWPITERYAINGRMLSVCANPSSCAGGTLPRMETLIEYHNTALDHYFMTTEGAETAAIDRGAAGPGWTRTGQTFGAYADIQGTGFYESPVCRFYGTPGRGPNSHFFTADASECSIVKADAGWTFESPAAFTIATAPIRRLPPGTSTTLTEKFCPGGRPVYRVYNNRFAQNDSNHRYVSDLALYESMKARGWLPEGVMMCAR